MKRLLFLSLGFFICFSSLGQNSKRLYDKFWSTVDSTPKESIKIIDSLISIYPTYSSFEMGEAYFGKGYAHFAASEYETSTKAYLEAAAIFKAINDTCYLKRAFFNLGSSFNMLGDFVSSSTYYLKYMEIEGCPDLEESDASQYYNLALLFNDMGFYKEANQYYLEATKTDSSGENIGFIALSRLGLLYDEFYKNKDLSVIQRYKNVIKKNKTDETNGFFIRFYGYADLASFYAQKENFDSSRKYLDFSIRELGEDSIPDYLAHILLTEAEFCEYKQNFPMAISFAKNGLAIAKEIEYLQLQMIATQYLSELFEKSGNSDSALVYLKLENQLRDSTYLLSTKSTFLSQQLEQKSKKVLKLIEEEKENRLKFEFWRNVVIGALTLIVLLIGIILFINKKSREIKKLNKELNLLIQEKNRIMTVLSHDLRTPISAVKGIIELVKMDVLTVEEKERVFLDLENSIDNLNVNLNSLLEWALATTGASNEVKENVNLKKAALEVLSLLQPSANRKKIGIKLIEKQENIHLTAVYNHITLIIRNLLSNAIKFSESESIIEVVLDKNEEYINLSVKDFGVGMTEEQIAKLKNGNTGKTKGTNGEKGLGIGIQLVKYYAKQSGGNLTIESELSRGSTFTVQFYLN